jgi:hypothetical protein
MLVRNPAFNFRIQDVRRQAAVIENFVIELTHIEFRSQRLANRQPEWPNQHDCRMS